MYGSNSYNLQILCCESEPLRGTLGRGFLNVALATVIGLELFSITTPMKLLFFNSGGRGVCPNSLLGVVESQSWRMSDNNLIGIRLVQSGWKVIE